MLGSCVLKLLQILNEIDKSKFASVYQYTRFMPAPVGL